MNTEERGQHEYLVEKHERFDRWYTDNQSEIEAAFGTKELETIFWDRLIKDPRLSQAIIQAIHELGLTEPSDLLYITWTPFADSQGDLSLQMSVMKEECVDVFGYEVAQVVMEVVENISIHGISYDLPDALVNVPVNILMNPNFRIPKFRHEVEMQIAKIQSEAEREVAILEAVLNETKQSHDS